MIIAHYNASESLSLMALGVRFPDSVDVAFALALKTARESNKMGGLEGQLLGFFLGSAFEYGVGTDRDLATAMTWYGVAAAAGDPVSKRELSRLQGHKE